MDTAATKSYREHSYDARRRIPLFHWMIKEWADTKAGKDSCLAMNSSHQDWCRSSRYLGIATSLFTISDLLRFKNWFLMWNKFGCVCVGGGGEFVQYFHTSCGTDELFILMPRSRSSNHWTHKSVREIHVLPWQLRGYSEYELGSTEGI